MIEKSQPVWKEVFTSWPANVPKRGVLVPGRVAPSVDRFRDFGYLAPHQIVAGWL